MNRDDAARVGVDTGAKRHLADYDAGRPGMMFAEGVVLSVAEAYELQTAVAELRRQRGERMIGYKVGCTSPTIRTQLGIDHSITGRLYDSEKHDSGGVLSRSEFAHLAIEGELAVELLREPSADDFLDDGLPTCVARVIPVIELHHFVMRGDHSSAAELIANNAIHAGFVAGPGVAAPDLSSCVPSLAIYSNDQLLEQCRGSRLIQSISSSLRWLMNIVRERGDRLGAGQIILTGSLPSLVRVEANFHLRVEAPPFGTVEATFVD